MQPIDETEYAFDRSVAEIEKLAAGRGLAVRYAAEGELLLDIDGPAARAAHFVLLDMAKRVLGIEVLDSQTTPSPSGREGHEHVVLRIYPGPNDTTERVLLQALLGSDPKRELLSLARIQHGAEERTVSVLFERRKEGF